jgi:hypothetical protein
LQLRLLHLQACQSGSESLQGDSEDADFVAQGGEAKEARRCCLNLFAGMLQFRERRERVLRLDEVNPPEDLPSLQGGADVFRKEVDGLAPQADLLHESNPAESFLHRSGRGRRVRPR